MAIEVAHGIFTAMTGEEVAVKTAAATSEVARATARLVESALLKHLINRVSTRAEGLVLEDSLQRANSRLVRGILIAHATSSRRAVDEFRSNASHMYVLHSAMSRSLVDQVLNDVSWLDDALEEVEEGEAAGAW
jgi:hypothetical protein